MVLIKPPLSIRIIYWLSNFSLGFFIVAFFIALLFNVLFYTTDFFGNDMQLHTALPVKVDFLETGSLYLNGQDIKVELVEASTRIHFIDTPSFITNKVGFVLLFVILFAIGLTWLFRTFIKNVKEGETFTVKNITLLQKLAYALVGFWLFALIYVRIFYYYIAKNLEFEHIRITDDFPNYKGILFAALFIWVLAHIFITGVKLQEEQDLTI